MGCCPSKSPAATTTPKEYAVTTAEAAPMLPSPVSVNQVEPVVLDNAVEEMQMDRDDDEEPGPEDVKLPPIKTDSAAKALDEVIIRSPERAAPPRKSSHTADDMPIASTYHRMHSAEVAKQEAKRQEEIRLEAELREREVREYKAAMQIA